MRMTPLLYTVVLYLPEQKGTLVGEWLPPCPAAKGKPCRWYDSAKYIYGSTA
ncbi:MAG: hypothetical protein PHN64_03930 [Desulfovibrionaceae bacterium]|nr:hypothetical protein [Desulfovibrionaceae bacterium]